MKNIADTKTINIIIGDSCLPRHDSRTIMKSNANNKTTILRMFIGALPNNDCAGRMRGGKRETRDEGRRARNERRETINESEETRNERRETGEGTRMIDERRGTRNEGRETKDEKRRTRLPQVCPMRI